MARPPTASDRRAKPASTHFVEVPINAGQSAPAAQARRLGGQGVAGHPNARRPPQPRTAEQALGQPSGLRQIFDEAQRETAAERPERTATRDHRQRGFATHLASRRPRDATPQTDEDTGSVDRGATTRDRSGSGEIDRTRPRSDTVETTTTLQSIIELDLSSVENDAGSASAEVGSRDGTEALERDAATDRSDDEPITLRSRPATQRDEITEEGVDHDHLDDVDPDDIAATTGARLFR